MDCHSTAWVLIPGGNSVKAELHVLRNVVLFLKTSMSMEHKTQPTNQPTYQNYKPKHVNIVTDLRCLEKLGVGAPRYKTILSLRMNSNAKMTCIISK